MDTFKVSIRRISEVLLTFILCSFLHAETVLHSPQPNESLSQKWEWARKEASSRGLTNGFWIGYNIQQMMGENEYFITGSTFRFDGIHKKGKPSLEEMITGNKQVTVKESTTDNQKVKKAAKNTLAELENNKLPEKRVLKSLAILFEFRSLSSSLPDDFAMLNTSLSLDLRKRTLLWLGKTDDVQSFELLRKLYEQSKSAELKEDLLYSIASHQNSTAVFPFLRQVLTGNSPDNLRSAAALSIGSHGSDEAIPLLVQVCKTDRSEEVRDDALNGLAEIHTPAGRAAILQLAKESPTSELREAAIYHVAEEASPKEISELLGILMKDPEEEVQEAALYALAELPDSTPLIIQAASTHPKKSLREAAVYQLAEVASDNAIQALNQIARKDPDAELQEAAMYALAELPEGKGITYLIEIARNHPNREIRIRAIYVLGDSEDEKAKEALLKLVGEN